MLAATVSNLVLTRSPHRVQSLGTPTPEPSTEGEDCVLNGSLSQLACAAGTRLATDIPDSLPADVQEFLQFIPTMGD